MRVVVLVLTYNNDTKLSLPETQRSDRQIATPQHSLVLSNTLIIHPSSKVLHTLVYGSVHAVFPDISDEMSRVVGEHNHHCLKRVRDVELDNLDRLCQKGLKIS